jgi:glutathione S-transferase
LWLLEELKVNYELKIYKRGQDGQAPRELKEVHPLGKSPVIGVQGPNMAKPKIIAESAVIVEFLLDHFGKSMIPEQYPTGHEGEIGAETEEWSRYRYFMHFAEGSVMPYLLVATVMRRECLPFLLIRAIAKFENRDQECVCAILHQADYSKHCKPRRQCVPEQERQDDL